jgi:hypothetical protein
VRGWLVALAVFVLAAPAALAHGKGPPHGGYYATFSNVDPPLLGLDVAVLGEDRRLRIANLSGKTVVILDEYGEPFLRFTPTAVFSREAGADWEQVATGTAYDWPEPRIGWNESSPPDVVSADPEQTHFIRDWSIAGRVEGRGIQIKGFLGWAPHAAGASVPGADAADGSTFFIAFTLTAVGILAAALLYVARRRASSTSRSA